MTEFTEIKAMRPLRFATAIQVLITLATEGKTTTYGLFTRTIGTSAGEVNFIIGLAEQFCRENQFPPYTVLIKNQETTKVGPGFFRLLNIPQDQQDSFEKECEQVCFTTPLPSQLKISLRLIEFIAKRLG